MFKLHKHKSGHGPAVQFDFSFSDFQAVKVPKGWDKLFVCLVSVETGKTIVKSVKANVRFGTCRWTDVFSQSLPPSVVKLVVAMGSSRSGVLGEVVFDLADYTASAPSVPLSLPLKKCNYATSLLFSIQCLTPNAIYRGAQNKEANVDLDSEYSDHDDPDARSDASGSTCTRSVGSASSGRFETASHSQAIFSRDPSLSASESRNSIDSIEVSSGKDIYISQHDPLGAANIGRQDSIESHHSGPSWSFRSTSDGSPSNNTSFRSRIPESLSQFRYQKEERSSGAFTSSALPNTGSSKDLLEAAEKVEELRAEARMWERNSKKLTAEVDVLKNEVFEQSQSLTNVNLELSASQQNCDNLKQEVQHLKLLFEESVKKEDATEDMNELQKEMGEEIRFLKDSNDNLNEQLQKTQESNIELLSILQELEGIIETQKTEIANLSSLKQKLDESEVLGSSKDMEFVDSDLKGSKVVPSMHAPDEQPTVAVDGLKLQLQELQETQEKLEGTIRILEDTIVEKDSEIEREQGLRVQALLDSESNWKLEIAAKEEEIKILEAKVDQVVKEGQNKDVIDTEDKAHLVQETEFLRRKVQDLEKDCHELTEENVKLLLKLKEPKKDIESAETLVSLSCIGPDGNSLCKCGSEMKHLRAYLEELQHELERKEMLIEEDATSSLSQVQCPDLENKCSELESQLQTFKETVICLEDELQKFHVQVKEQQIEIHALQQQLQQSKVDKPCSGDRHLVVAKCIEEDGEEDHNIENGNLERPDKSDGAMYTDVTEFDLRALENNSKKAKEIEALQGKLSKVENQIETVHDEKRLLEETMESLGGEKILSSESVEELRKEIESLSSSVEMHMSASKVLERLSSDLERGKLEVEHQLSELERENMQLSERISALEAQLRYLTNEKETCHLELQHSEAQAMYLRDEMKRLETEMEAQKVDMNNKLQDMRIRWLEAEEECEYLKKANPKLQSTTENLIEECYSLQKLNGELRRQNMELHTSCIRLESDLRDSEGRFSECSEKLEALEAEFSNLLEEVSLKEKSLSSELDSLIVEDKEHRGKLIQENIRLTDAYSKKVFELENVQSELAHLIDQISVAHEEKELVNSEAILELSVSRADKAKLETELHDLLGKFTYCQSKLGTIESECEAKLHEATREITASRKKEEVLIADLDKLSAFRESFKSNEEKYKSIISELEMKLKASQFETKQVCEEISTLQDQINRAKLLHDELVVLKTSLSESKFEYEREKASLDLLRGDYEQMKTEKDSLVLKIIGLEKALSELEDCQRTKVALQEKVLRLEGDLAAREALSVQDAELKFELSRSRRANGELQRKIKHLEKDHEGYSNRIELLEEQLKWKIQTTRDLMQSAGVLSDLEDAFLVKIAGSEDTDYFSKIQSLENELSEALEANDMYKTQLRRFLSDEQKGCIHMPKTGENRPEFKKHGSNVISLEKELTELRERYSQMSLKYAEVEAQRAELVLKLKSTNNSLKKRWFS